MVITGGKINDTTMMTTVLHDISVPRSQGRSRTRPDRVLADTGCPSKANRAWLRQRGIATIIPEREDQIAHRRRERDRPQLPRWHTCLAAALHWLDTSFTNTA